MDTSSQYLQCAGSFFLVKKKQNPGMNNAGQGQEKQVVIKRGEKGWQMDGLREERSEESRVWRLQKKCNKTIKRKMTGKKRHGREGGNEKMWKEWQDVKIVEGGGRKKVKRGTGCKTVGRKVGRQEEAKGHDAMARVKSSKGERYRQVSERKGLREGGLRDGRDDKGRKRNKWRSRGRMWRNGEERWRGKKDEWI